MGSSQSSATRCVTQRRLSHRMDRWRNGFAQRATGFRHSETSALTRPLSTVAAPRCPHLASALPTLQDFDWQRAAGSAD